MQSGGASARRMHSASACDGRASWGRVGSVELDLRGHPLHTRALSLELRQRADGALGAAGVLLDLRKRSSRCLTHVAVRVDLRQPTQVRQRGAGIHADQLAHDVPAHEEARVA